MGSKDTLTKDYLSRNDIFADAFNYCLFDGEEVIKPEFLTEQDATELAVIEKFGKVFASQKMRDVLRLCTIKHSDMATLVILGIEGQANVHYAMPVRDMLYDALNYAAQVENARKRHREEKDIKGNEYLSGFSRDDRLVPVITLCVCFDKEMWDAPRTLHEMFGGVDDRIRAYVNDYKINLIVPGEVDDFRKFSSELGLVMEFIRNSDDKNWVRDIIRSSDERYRDVDVKTADMINIYTSANISMENTTKGGRVNMCKAIQELIEDERSEGREEGRKEGESIGADKFANLIKAIKAEGGNIDVALSANETKREKLYEKYNIV